MPVLAWLDPVITPNVQQRRLLPGFEMYTKFFEELLVLSIVTVTDKHPVVWHPVAPFRARRKRTNLLPKWA
jgi:hypothetical protein